MNAQFSKKKILLVDDNPSFVRLLRIFLKEIGFTFIQTADDFKSGLQLFLDQPPDICLLDAALASSDRNGIELAEEIRLRNLQVPIIFLTSSYTEDQYDQCRHVRPSNYLNKELSRFKLQQALDMAFMNLTLEDIPQAPSANEETPHDQSQNFFFKIGNYYKKISLDEIAFFFAKDKFTYARVNDRNFPTNVHLKALETELQSIFQRIHKTYLVNIDYIEHINPRTSMINIGGEKLPIGYAYRKSFFDRVKLLK